MKNLRFETIRLIMLFLKLSSLGFVVVVVVVVFRISCKQRRYQIKNQIFNPE